MWFKVNDQLEKKELAKESIDKKIFSNKWFRKDKLTCPLDDHSAGKKDIIGWQWITYDILIVFPDKCTIISLENFVLVALRRSMYNILKSTQT